MEGSVEEIFIWGVDMNEDGHGLDDSDRCHLVVGVGLFE
jgi:hypothetical protein